MKTFDLLMIEKRGNDTIYFDKDSFNSYLKKYSKISDCKDRYSFYYNLDLMYNLINQNDKLTVVDMYNSIIVGLETGSNHSLIIDFENKKIYGLMLITIYVVIKEIC